jgi:hypothetical protein
MLIRGVELNTHFMKTRLISFGCWLAGIVIVLGLYAVAIVAFGKGYPWLIFLAVVLAALDAKRTRVWRYESDIAQRPSTLFLLMLFLGWLILPWYVGLRLKILAGTARLKEDYQWLETPTESYRDPSPPAGLVQPWSARWRGRFWRSTVQRPHGDG